MMPGEATLLRIQPVATMLVPRRGGERALDLGVDEASPTERGDHVIGSARSKDVRWHPHAIHSLLPLGAHRLQTPSVRRDFMTLVDKHGSSWGENLFSEWTKDSAWRTPAWVSGLADLCEDLHVSTACAWTSRDAAASATARVGRLVHHAPPGCPCADCKELARVLRSSHGGHDWPLPKDRRQHIHGMIDSAKLPVLHTTLRQGSPHVLQLRKDLSLFSRETDYRTDRKSVV